MRCRTLLINGALAVAVAACSSSRPEGPTCQGVCDRPEGPIALLRPAEEKSQNTAPSPALNAMGSERFGRQLQMLMRQKADTVPLGVPERALADLPRTEEGRLNILAISAGGPFGAFGAGFLNGWSEQTSPDLKRPEAFEIVTGVSAGALLATHAFLGRSGDQVLREQYTTISTADILSERSLLGALFSNALFDTSPLRRTLERLVTPALLDQVAGQTGYSEENGSVQRMLLVLAVNLDSGRPKILDLGAIARDKENPDRRSRYIDALMASVAIPVAFPPVFIDGDMHADGGVRLILFFNDYMEDQRQSVEDRPVSAPRLDIIVNSEINLEPTCTDNTLLGVSKRSFSVVLDQIALDSLYRAINEAERDGTQVRYVTAEGSGCRAPSDPADMFEPTFIQCLFAHGKNVGSSQSPWKAGSENLPDGGFSALKSSRSVCSRVG